MTVDDLLGDVAATGLLDERELLSIVMYWQTRGKTKNAHFRFNCTKRLQRYIELTYESDWDENGVIFWIGSKVSASVSLCLLMSISGHSHSCKFFSFHTL